MPIAIRVNAKVNLHLRILGKRPDGYHEIETAMHPIDLADTLAIEPAEAFALECAFEGPAEGAPAPPLEANTVWRAWGALRRLRPGRVAPIRARLRKRIPMQAGLGGGSADAAAALLALDRLFDLRCTTDELRLAAADIGSDVPFFLAGGPAAALGRGENIQPLQGSIHGRIGLAISRRGVSTAEAYRRFSPQNAEPGPPLRQISRAIEQNDAEAVFSGLYNAFEKLVFPIRPDLACAKQRFADSGANGALMSGSGATVFGAWKSADPAVENRPASDFAAKAMVWTDFCESTYRWLP